MIKSKITTKQILVYMLVALLLAAGVFGAFWLFGCRENASDYTEEQHTARVSELVEKRYMKQGSGYTDYTLYPLYNEKEELRYFLVEFAPAGFVYIKIYQEELRQACGRYLGIYTGMYIRHIEEGATWRRYKVEVGITPIPNKTNDMGIQVQYPDRLWWEVDEDDEYVEHTDSHFKVAGIAGERRYLLQITPRPSLRCKDGYIPAVKRGDAYLNLVSMEEMYLHIDEDMQAVAEITFDNYKHLHDL